MGDNNNINNNNLINILNCMEDGVYIVNQENDIEYVNPSLTKEFGPYQGKKCYYYFHDRTEVCPWCKNQDVFLGKTVRWEWYSHKTNKTYDLIDTPLKNADGSLSKLEIFRDITERKLMEQKLKESAEEKFRNLVNNVQDIIFELDENFICTYVNPQVYSISGYHPEELVGLLYFDWIHPDDVLRIKNELEELLNSRKPLSIEFRRTHKKGYYIHINTRCSLVEIDGKKRIICISRDITDRKKAEEERNLNSEIMTNLAEGIYLIRTSDLEIVWANPRFEEMFGYNRGEMIGKRATIVNAPTDKTPEETAEEIVSVLERTGEWHGEVNNIKKDGTQFWCYVNVSVFNHPEYGEVLVSVHTDITKRKKAEKELKNALETTNIILEAMPVGIILFRYDKTVYSANKIALNMIGYENQKDIIGEFCYNILCTAGNESCPIIGLGQKSDELHILCKEGNKFCPILDYGQKIDKSERCIINRDGIEIPILKSVIPIKLGNVEFLLEAFIDVSVLKESEKKYIREFKRANFYKDLFAHDISNILSAMNGAIELYNIYQNDAEKLAEKEMLLNIVKDQSVKASLLVSNVRKLSLLEEEGTIIVKEVYLSSVLNEAINFIRKSFQDRQIDIHVNYALKSPKVQANDLLLEVFENILNNAVKYNDKTNVKIQVNISRELRNKKYFVKLEFIDNGIGISDESKEFIFKKGYKEQKGHKGMGFGLTLVKTLIKSYKGKIWVEDKVKGDYNKGSKFVILIPEHVK